MPSITLAKKPSLKQEKVTLQTSFLIFE
jgi:hypothetical protein